MLVLASSSPRRIGLLQEWGYDFGLIQPSVEEDFLAGDLPETVVEDLARRKALCGLEVWRNQTYLGYDIILGADTIVILGGRIFGKPETAEDALGMLRKLSGKTHKVMTAIALVGIAENNQDLSIETSLDVTTVSFRDISDQEIRDYIATGEPMDKAAAYGIQGQARRFVNRIDGSLTNVIGLPMELLSVRLKEKNIFPKEITVKRI